VLDRLLVSPGVFWGEGHGADRGALTVRVAVRAHADGSVTLDYEAWAAQGGLRHAEATRMYRSDGAVVLVATSVDGGGELAFREGDAGVFGSVGGHRVGLVLDVEPPDAIALAWWWPDAHGTLRQQSRAQLRLCRPLAASPGMADGVACSATNGGAADRSEQAEVPWPGILVLDGPGTGVVAAQLAERLSRAAVVRTDLFDQAVRGSKATPDPELRERVAVAVVQAYAEAGHPVLLHGRVGSAEQRRLVDVLLDAGLRPVRLVEVADGEGYGEVARRLIQGD
jgi:uncharacterized protein YndB with AHSA1/START domain